MVMDKKIIPFAQFHINSKKQYTKKIGWLCTYVPEEIIIASGFSPARIIGKDKVKKAEGYCPINFCPYIKSALEDILNSSSNLEGIVFTNSCDGMRRLYDLCNTYIADLPSFLLDVPRNKNEIAVKHFENNILKMIDFLESLSSKTIELTDLENSIKLCNEKRALLKRLNNYFKNLQSQIGIKNYFQILKFAMTEEPENFIEDLKKYLNYLDNEIDNKQKSSNISNNPEANNRESRIMIIGNFLDEDRLWDVFDELSCKISADDICNSSRYFENVTEPHAVAGLLNGYHSEFSTKNSYADLNTCEKKDKIFLKLIRDIAVRQLYKPQCMRMSDLNFKLVEIKRNIKNNNIGGVIFISQKFCDNTLLFYPLFRQQLNMVNIPSLLLEIEHNNISTGQIKTRVQAFLEII
ncbi:MAG: 2-hydroxyacyl-CoA dehydratase [Actinobacteria bacterium]|nr:2-hydroxyacyl-CoA dehydratase [Actinomycetota bacterium]